MPPVDMCSVNPCCNRNADETSERGPATCSAVKDAPASARGDVRYVPGRDREAEAGPHHPLSPSSRRAHLPQQIDSEALLQTEAERAPALVR